MQSNGSASAESSGLDSLLSDFKDDGKSQGQGGSERAGLEINGSLQIEEILDIVIEQIEEKEGLGWF